MQWRKNTSHHRIINRAPYEAVFGPIRHGIYNINLPREILDSLDDEDDLETAIEEFNWRNKLDLLEGNASIVTNSVVEKEAKGTSTCNCGVVLDEGADECLLCSRGKKLLDTRQNCFNRQKLAAQKMVTFTQTLFPPLQIGDTVTVAVPSVDRGPLDFANILGIIIAQKNDLYRIGTKHGIVKDFYARPDIIKCSANTLVLEDVPENIISMREAAGQQSLTGGQGFKKCRCQANKTQCQTNRCVCFKAGMLCNSRCHSSSTCKNKNKT